MSQNVLFYSNVDLRLQIQSLYFSTRQSVRNMGFFIVFLVNFCPHFNQ